MAEETRQAKVSIRTALERAERALSSVLLDDINNRGQAKAWLISTVFSLKAVPGEVRLACLDPCNNNSSSSSRRAEQQQSPISGCKAAQLQLLQLLMEQQPAEVSELLSSDPEFLASYFTASPANISRWFGHFSMAGIQHFKFGAKALANYALGHRSEVWQLLAWSGKHTQAPVAVAAKPHYFCELDVQRTVRALARDCPRFWESDELLRSCQRGDWLAVDPQLVAEELHHLLHSGRSVRGNQLQQLLRSFLQAADWSQLCKRLLPLLPDQQMVELLEVLGQQQQQLSATSLQQWLKRQADYNSSHLFGTAAAGTAASAAAVDQLPCVADQAPLLLSSLRGSWHLQQALVANALTSHRAQLLRLLQQEDDASQLQQLVEAAQQVWQVLPDACNNGSASPQGMAARPAAETALAELLQDGAPFERPQQRLQLLLLAWLLRLHLLLAAADAAASSTNKAGVSMQQLVQALGCCCSLVTDGHQQQLEQSMHCEQQPESQQRLHTSGPPQPAAGQQPQDQPEHQASQQQQNHAAEGSVQRTPLKRGPSASTGQGTQQDAVQRPKSSLQSKKRKRRRHRADSSSSAGDGASGSDSDVPVGSKWRRHSSSSKQPKSRKHKRAKRRRTSSRKSSSGGGDDGDENEDAAGVASEDLDADGQLLDLADFPPSAAAAAGDEGAAAAGSGGAGRQVDRQAVEVLRRLEMLSVGGQLWEQPRWLLQVPGQSGSGRATLARHGTSGCSAAGRGREWCAVTGTTAAVVDAVACYWLWDVLLMGSSG